MLSTLSAIAGIWLTVLITTAIIFVLFGILFVVILLVRKKARAEEATKEGKSEVNLEELQKILDTIKAKQQAETEEKKDNGE